MDTPLWTRISRVNSFNHRELDGEDICLFLHTRETHQYGEIDQWSYAYQTIENFKISPVALQNNPARRRYKEQAVQTITNDLAMLFRDANPRARFLLVPAVTSKSRTDPNYDDRLIKVCSTVASRFPNVDSFELLSISRTIASAHTGAGTRNVNALLSNIVVDTSIAIRDYASVLIFDDVISSGAHFKTCKLAIQRAYGNDVPIEGVFWARTASWGESEDL